MDYRIRECLCATCAIGMESRDKHLKLAGIDHRTHAAHQLQIVMKIVDGIEPRPKYLSGAVQMIQVGTGKVATCITIASLVQRLCFVSVTRILDLDIAE